MRSQKPTQGRSECSVAAALGLAWVAMATAAAAEPAFEGLSLEDAIGALEDEGLRVFYSSDVVKPSMRVVRQPTHSDLRDQLRELLEPHALTIQTGPRDSVLIVRGPAVRVTETPSTQPPVTVAPTRVEAAQPPIDEIVVAASRYELARAGHGEPFRLAGTDLEALPDLGEDSLRAVQRLPGAAADGFNARAHVRGGELGELLVRLDGLRLYDPYHLEDFQSIFGAIDPRIVSTMDVYTGGFPAPFGDRMSGVIDVASLAPSARYQELGMSFFNLSGLSAGQFAGQDGEWVASVRRSNLDLLYNNFSDMPERPRYVDAFGKVAYRPTDSLRVALNVLYSRDDITLNDDLDIEETASSHHEDRYAWLRFEHTPSANLSGTTLLAHATLSGDRRGVTAKPGLSEGWLVDRRSFVIDTLQSEWSWRRGDAARWSAVFGAMVGRSRGEYDYRDTVEFDLLLAVQGAPTELTRARVVRALPSGGQHALYGSLRYEPTSRLAMDIGARWDHQTLEPGTSGGLGPRASLRYRLGDRTSLRLSGGRFEQSQAINELQVSDGMQRFSAPQRSRHAVLGVEHEFANGVELRAEAYQKAMSRLSPRYENVLHSLTLVPELKPDRTIIAPESALARGVELSIGDGRAARLDWWASYSYGRVRDRIAGVDVLRSWDQTHAVSGGLGWETPRWNLSMAATYRSGWPRTVPLGLTEDDGVPVVVTGGRNAEHAGAFRSLDLRATRVFSLRRGELSAFFELTNALDHRNECCSEYEVESDDLGATSLSLSPVAYLPRVPSLGFVWSF